MKHVTVSPIHRPQLYDPVEFVRMLLELGPVMRPWSSERSARVDWVEAYRFGRRAVRYARPDHRYVRPPVQLLDGHFGGHSGTPCARVLQ